MGLFDGTPLEQPVTCERCAKPLAECRCPRDAMGAVLLPGDQPARIRREKRRGKPVAIITGLDPVATDLKALLKELRTSLGAGGSITGPDDARELIIQGDHRDAIVELLKQRGYPAKPSGG